MSPIYIDSLNDAVEQVFSKVQFWDRNRPPYLYHYTTWEALKNIVRRNRLWATCAAESPKNDEKEIAYGCDLFKQFVDNRLKSTKVTEFTSVILREMRSAITERISTIFLTSFTALNDDAKMFRDFGDFCLRFPVRDGRTGMIAPRGLGAGRGFSTELCPAIYDKEEHDSALGSIVDDLVETFGKRSLIPNYEYTGWAPALAKFIAFTVVDFALRFLTCLKSPEFEREMEWRVVVRPSQLHFASDMTEADRSCAHFVKPGPPKRHVELEPERPIQHLRSGVVFDLPHPESNLPFDAVRIGPSGHPRAIDSVHDLLNKYDLQAVEVSRNPNPER